MHHDTPLLLTKRLANGLRAFTSGCVVAEDGLSLIVQFTALSIHEVGDEIALYREGEHALVIQNYRVLHKKHMPSSGGVQLKVRPVDEPRPFDLRQSQRMPSAHAMIVAEFGGEANCIVVDVADESLGIIARAGHSVGDDLELRIDMAFTGFTGTVTVCSVREEVPVRSRYGIVGANDGQQSARQPLDDGSGRSRYGVVCKGDGRKYEMRQLDDGPDRSQSRAIDKDVLHTYEMRQLTDGPRQSRYGVVCRDEFQKYEMRQCIRQLKPLIQTRSPQPSA